MKKKDIGFLIDKIGDPAITSLADIARLSYPVFLRRTGNRLGLTECHHLYQLAVHSQEAAVSRAQRLRKYPSSSVTNHPTFMPAISPSTPSLNAQLSAENNDE